MRTVYSASTATSFLLLAALTAHVDAQTASESEATLTTSSGTDSSITSATLEPTSSAEPTCSCSFKPILFEFSWPDVTINETVVAMVIVKVDRTTNETSTITSYVEGAVTGVAQNIEDVWNLALNTTGVTMSDGSAVVTLTRSIYSDVNDFFTTTQRLVHPTAVMDFGYRAVTTDYAEVVTVTTPTETITTECLASAAAGTIVLTPLDDKYDVEVHLSEWLSMVPSDITSRCGFDAAAPHGAVNVQSALTETTTEYDDYQHSQVTSTKKTSEQTTPSSAKATTTTSPKEEIKEGTEQTQPVSTQRPTQNPPTQNPPTQDPPTPDSPASVASPLITTQTSTYTPVILGGSTLTAGGPAVTISGTTYVLGTSSDLVVNDNTLGLATSPSSATTGDGGPSTLVWEGPGGTIVTASQTGPVTVVATFTGAAVRNSVVTRSFGWASQALAVVLGTMISRIL